MRQVIIETEVWEKYPSFRRGILLVRKMRNPLAEDEVAQLLEQERIRRMSGETLQDSAVLAWDEMHRRFGSNPNKFPPSLKSLLKRVGKGDQLPFINTVVALFNVVSLKYLLPCGGDDLAAIGGDLCLGLAKGDERFLPLGGSEEEHPLPGEVIYYDGASRQVMCRRWNWRNGDFSKITERSEGVVINIDGAEIVPTAVLLAARDELAGWLERICSAEVETKLLTRTHPSQAIDF
ncbi:MAG: phenylalanine--tRNA ligase beta subunit-related protein [bacterium]